jgi:molybdopterin-guanine dinucleotide biosynthesis protein A
MPFAAALLAGGRSSRMGRDKAFLDWRGEPLWKIQLQRLAELDPARLLISCRSEQAHLFPKESAEFIFDPPDNPGPLGAILGCLERTGLPVLVLAVDMPGMTIEFLRALYRQGIEGHTGVICRATHGYEPLCAFYPESALPLLRNQLQEGHFKMQTAVQRLIDAGLMQVRELRAEEISLFRNANTPEEYTAWTTSAPQASN